MENIVHTLVTLLAALLVAVGGPAHGVDSADRPAIVQAPVAPAADALKVYDTRGTIQDVRGSEIVVDGATFGIERETEIQGELRVGGKVDVEAKHAENGSSVALKIQVEKPDDSSSNGTGELAPKSKEDQTRLTEKEKDSLDSSADRSSQDSPKAVEDQQDQGLTKGQEKANDDKSASQSARTIKSDDSKTQTTTTVKPDDSKSTDHSAKVEPSDNKSTSQVESKQDSPKSNDSQASHTDTKSSDDHKSDDHKGEDNKSKDSHD